MVPECDPVLLALLKIQESKKKQIVQAAAEALGKVLKRQPSLRRQATARLMVNEGSERHDVLVHSIEKVTREFPELLEDRRLFMKALAFVKVLTGSMRAAVLKALERYLLVAKLRRSLDDINAVALSLLADAEDVLADISDENQQAFLQVLTQIAKLNVDAGDKLLLRVLPRLKQLFAANKNDYSRGLFYDLMVFLYDQFPALRPLVKGALVRGLSDKSKLVRDKLTGFWSNPARLGLDAPLRLQQLMDALYT